ncbi:MAG: DUF4093 domain-containing protein [Clostridia bacterium]|nr:DUF4093 domain-containing protein [Clostridia bacterium]
MEDKIKIPVPVIVEGKYDKMKLSSVIDADIITTDGFGIFKKSEKISLIKRLSENGIVLLCDSDGAGGVIRRYVMSAVPKERIYNLYIPQIEGKERRKSAPSKEGTLGVEGMDEELLAKLFRDFLRSYEKEHGRTDRFERKDAITKADLYEYGFTGKKNSSSLRDALSVKFGLPKGMTSGALLGALRLLTDRDGYIEAAEEIVRDMAEV